MGGMLYSSTRRPRASVAVLYFFLNRLEDLDPLLQRPDIDLFARVFVPRRTGLQLVLLDLSEPGMSFVEVTLLILLFTSHLLLLL